jgi:fibronectin type 3 domain-containing protein
MMTTFRLSIHRLLLVAVLQSLVGAAATTGASAQQRPDLWLIAHGDTVLIQVPEPPVPNYGFIVYRAAAGSEHQRLTDDPVFPIRQPAFAASLVSDHLPALMDMTGATDEVQMLRRLQSDRIAGGIAAVLFREAGIVLGRFHADTSVAPGQAYDYRLVFLNAAGEETDEVRTGSITVTDVPPQRPPSVAGSAASFEATVSWRFPAYTGAPLDFVHGFHVYRAEAAGGFIRITELPQLRSEIEEQQFVDHDVRNDTEYHYRVTSVDIAGRESEPSAEVSLRPVDDRAPTSPADVVTEPGDGRVRIDWRMSPELNVTGYFVERSTGLDQPFERIVAEPIPAASPGYTDTGVRGGTQYFYRVVAVNGNGRESRPTNALSALPYDETPPRPPADVIATARGRQLEIRWSASSSDDVQGYHIYRGDASGAVRLTTRPLAGTTFIDTGFNGSGLRPGGSYVVRVAAVDHSYNESESISAEVRIIDDEPPAAPTALQVRGVEGRFIELQWMPGGAQDVERYVLTRTDEGGTALREIASVAAHAALRVRDDDVRSGNTYAYRLVAVDSAGNTSDAADARVQLRAMEPPPAPRHVTALAEPGGVRVRWERVADSELAGYLVYRASISTGVYQPVSGVITPDATLAYVDVDGGAGHYYTVRAIDRSGNESRPSPAAAVRQP